MNCYRFLGFLSLAVLMQCSVFACVLSVTCYVSSLLIHFAVSLNISFPYSTEICLWAGIARRYNDSSSARRSGDRILVGGEIYRTRSDCL